MIVGIAGQIGSGKDTIADYLVTQHGFKRVSFADSLKSAVSKIFGWEKNMLNGTTKSSRQWREEVDEWWSTRLGIPNLTPRMVLQQFGTDVCRNHFHQDIWIASVENKLLKTTDNVVITDCRFPNEVAAIKNSNGTTVRVERGPKPDWYEYAVALNKGPSHLGWAIARSHLEQANVHPSEYSSVGLKYDHLIKNDGTIDDLYKKVESIIN